MAARAPDATPAPPDGNMDVAVPQTARIRTADQAQLSPQPDGQPATHQPSRQRTGSPFAGFSADQKITHLKDETTQKFIQLEQHWLQKFQEIERRIDILDNAQVEIKRDSDNLMNDLPNRYGDAKTVQATVRV